MASASSWSCVTMMVVMPSRRCTARISTAAPRAPWRRAPRAARRAAGGPDRAPWRGRAPRAAAGHRKLGGQLRRVLGQMHQLEHGIDARAYFRLGPPPAFEAIGHVARRAHIGEQRVGLEDDAEIPVLGGCVDEIRPVEADLAAIGALQPGNDPQKRGLAAAGGAEEADEGAVRHVEGDTVEGRGPPRTVSTPPGSRDSWPYLPRPRSALELLLPGLDDARPLAGGSREVDREQHLETSAGRPALMKRSGMVPPGTVTMAFHL